MTTDDDWVKHAKTDDSVVAEILIRLARADKPPSPQAAALSLDWSVRQRRSRAPAARRRRRRKKKADQTRASPTTPLSWTGATTSAGSEDSTKPAEPSGGARSKNEATNTSKRPRKKRTLAELKEEETLLLKERKNLRKEVETMRLNVQIQRATNESLKRLKLDFESKEKVETLPNTNGHNAVQCSLTPSLSHKAKDVEIRGTGIPLPDLNLPVEGDLDSSAAYCGIS